MAPGGEMFRYPQHFGENVLRHGSHEWLPYSIVAVRAEIVKHQFAALIFIRPEGTPKLSTFHCQLSTENISPFPTKNFPKPLDFPLGGRFILHFERRWFR